MIEAALIAANMRPGCSGGASVSSAGWARRGAWSAVRDEAQRNRRSMRWSAAASRQRRESRRRARRARERDPRRDSVSTWRSDRRALEDLDAESSPAGLVFVNPPYGARLGEVQDLAAAVSPRWAMH